MLYLRSGTIVEAVITDGKPLIIALARDAVFDTGTDINLRFDPECPAFFLALKPARSAHRCDAPIPNPHSFSHEYPTREPLVAP